MLFCVRAYVFIDGTLTLAELSVGAVTSCYRCAYHTPVRYKNQNECSWFFFVDTNKRTVHSESTHVRFDCCPVI